VKEQLKILAVEDDLLNMTLLKDTLLMHCNKIKINEAYNGREALKMLENSHYDLIIMDIRMPELDGYETTKYIREKLKTPKNIIPILGLSAHAIKEEIEKGKLIGMNDFISKPIDPVKLFEKIDQLTHSKTNTEKREHEKDVIKKPDSLVIDLGFFENLFKNDRKKINQTILTYSNEMPSQLQDLTTFLENGQFENIKLTAHSMKSTFRYIGRDDLSETAKQIENIALNEKDEKLLKTKINELFLNWGHIDLEIKKILQQQ